jgi:hypothetical protein
MLVALIVTVGCRQLWGPRIYPTIIKSNAMCGQLHDPSLLCNVNNSLKTALTLLSTSTMQDVAYVICNTMAQKHSPL